MKPTKLTLILLIIFWQVSYLKLAAQAVNQSNVPDISNLMEQVDGGSLRTHVEALQSFGTRHVNSAQHDPKHGIGAARDYIYGQFEQIAQNANGHFHAQLQEFDMNYNGVFSHQNNVIGILDGADPNAGFLVVGAHYDSINTDFTDARGFAPGANDNATGVAGLIEITRILSQNQYRSGIITVAFSAEELNRVGSRAFVTWAQANNLNIVGMVNIDSIGNSHNAISGQIDESLRVFSCETESFCADGGQSRQMARSAELIAVTEAAPLELHLQEQADRKGRYGDHFSFAEAGFPSIRFINTLEEWGNGSLYDVVDYVEWDYLRKSTQSIILVVASLASFAPPNQIALQTDENNQSTLVWDEVSDADGYMIVFRDVNSPSYDAQVFFSSTNTMQLNLDSLANNQQVAVAIATRSNDGHVGRLSQEYLLADLPAVVQLAALP